MSEVTNSFSILPDLARRMPRVSSRWLWYWRLFYRFRAAWRHVRVSRVATRLLGRQFRRSREMIEIDITYSCNLHCLNCNRSVRQARDALHMSQAAITRFVDESIGRGKRWRRIRVLGGEPTMHPEFDAILAELLRYRRWNEACIVEVVTNGFGPSVAAVLGRLPAGVLVDNSAKTGRIQPHFGPFNMAPVDDPTYAHSDYSNGCAVMRDCGMGLTPMGYYPCAVAGGIDRITGDGLGEPSLPHDTDDMAEAAARLCRLCGRFRDGHFVPRLLRPVLDTEQISPTWTMLYARWQARRAVQARQAKVAAPADSD